MLHDNNDKFAFESMDFQGKVPHLDEECMMCIFYLLFLDYLYIELIYSTSVKIMEVFNLSRIREYL